MEKEYIRKVNIGDADTLAYIQTNSWQNGFKDILSKEELDKYADINKAKQMYTYLLENEIGNGYILFVNEKPHLIVYWDKFRDEDMIDFAELICIHSLSENWNKGYGSMVMEYIINEVKIAGYNKMYLWVFEKNIRARRFYEKHGFYAMEKKKMFNNVVEIMYQRVM